MRNVPQRPCQAISHQSLRAEERKHEKFSTMLDIIFINGAPGIGKSTISKLLSLKLDSPLFEFGWIPEFQNKGFERMGYKEEEAFSFENLSLVLHNYVRH